jgi:hypothetical protein
MADLILSRPTIPAMSEAAIGKVRELESIAVMLPQVPIGTDHVLHAGLYARTVMVPAGVLITGVLIKIATLLIVQGDALVYIGGEPTRLNGYNVVPAAAGRKQAFIAESDVYLTMIFPTDALDVDEAERQFTDEVELLVSRKEQPCQL